VRFLLLVVWQHVVVNKVNRGMIDVLMCTNTQRNEKGCAAVDMLRKVVCTMGISSTTVEG